jgi:soluble lytic murein transglycosylase-like protein
MNAVIKKIKNLIIIAFFLYISGMLFGYYKADITGYGKVNKIKSKIEFLYCENGVKLKDYLASEIAKSIIESSAAYHIQENMILAIIKCESDFNPYETSYTTDIKRIVDSHKETIRTNFIPLAMGLMQVNFTAGAWGNIFTNRNKYYDIYYNINCGSFIFSYLSKMEENDTFKALVKYNGGYEIHTGNNKTVYNSISYFYAKSVLKVKTELDEMDKQP